VRAFRNSDEQSISELKEPESIPFGLIRKMAFFSFLLTLSEMAFSFVEELFEGYETPSTFDILSQWKDYFR
jgi:hypothetical protein